MDRGAWRAAVHRVAESDMTKVTYHACKLLTQRWVRKRERERGHELMNE